MTFREAIAAVELGLIPGDQLPDIAMTGLLQGHESKSLAALAGEPSRRYDSVECHRLWRAALDELGIPLPARVDAARSLVHTYARLVAGGALAPRLGAARIVDVRHEAETAGCDASFVGDCIGAAQIIGLFYSHDDCGVLDQVAHAQIDAGIFEECCRLARDRAVEFPGSMSP